MNFKRYHVSRNLFDVNKEWVKSSNTDTVIVSGNSVTITSKYYAKAKMPVPRNTDCVIKANVFEEGITTVGTVAIYESDSSTRIIYSEISAIKAVPFNTGNNDEIWVYLYASAGTEKTKTFSEIMLNTGSQPLPYEPYSSEVWHDTPHYVHKTATDTITTLPANIYPNAATATVGLKGNMMQNGTASPTTPIQPSETGERTAQLLPYPYYSPDDEYSGVQFTTNGERVVANGTTNGGFLFFLWRTGKLVTGTYSITVRGSHSGASVYVRDVTNAQTIVAIYGGQAGDRTETFTLDSDISVFIYINASSVTTLDFNCTIMLNTGSTALPYENYGYKIPISSASTTTPVYLGEVETTRKIKELVFDGSENWRLFANQGRNAFYVNIADGIGTDVISSHFKKAESQDYPEYGAVMYNGNSNKNIIFRMLDDTTITTATEFKQWVAQQYAAGTPVCVWYVLSTPQTAVVNEPIRKIGDYADTLSNVTIPVTAGGDTISIGTTLQPSEVTATYKGWHPVADVHERDDGAWT